MNSKNLLSWLAGIGLVYAGVEFFPVDKVVFILIAILLLPPIKAKLPFTLTPIKWVSIAFSLFIIAAILRSPKIEAERRNDFNQHKADILKTINSLYNVQNYQDAKAYTDKYAVVDDPELKGLTHKIDAAQLANEEKAKAEAAANEKIAEKAAEDAKKQEIFDRDAIAGAEITLAASLKDPDSAQFKGVYVSYLRNGKEEVPVVCGQVNSKNGFGGYSGFQYFMARGDVAYLQGQSPDFAFVWQKACKHPK